MITIYHSSWHYINYRVISINPRPYDSLCVALLYLYVYMVINIAILYRSTSSTVIDMIALEARSRRRVRQMMLMKGQETTIINYSAMNSFSQENNFRRHNQVKLI